MMSTWVGSVMITLRWVLALAWDATSTGVVQREGQTTLKTKVGHENYEDMQEAMEILRVKDMEKRYADQQLDLSFS
jgi:hypothetical protein